MKATHPIRVVARRTGLSTHLIRMWERRYKAVEPERTDTGRRLYSDEDIERLSLLRQATLTGETIGQIANLSTEELARLVADARAATSEAPATSPASTDDAEYHLELSLEAIRNLDAVNLELRLLSASVALGQQPFLEQVLQPLLRRTGEMWADGRLKVAHEHLASAVIRSLLGSMFVSARPDQSGPLLVSTTPTGQSHEFGALMASVTAAAIGWRAIYLGPDLPAEDIAAAVDERGADALALSIVYPPDDPRLPMELRKLSRMLSADLPVFIGGRSAASYEPILEEIGATRITDLGDLRERLTELRRKISNQKAG